MKEESMSRRAFLRLSRDVTAGAAVGARLVPALWGVGLITELIPGYDAGNASFRERMEGSQPESEAQSEQPVLGEEPDHPATQPEDAAPVYEYAPTPREIAYGTLVVPPIEEGLFRALPSGILNLINQWHADGAERINGLTRREWVAGGTTSLLFGGVHNFTRRGFDTRTIPSPQIVSGMVFWHQQRTRGYLASTATHAGVNGTSLAIAAAL